MKKTARHKELETIIVLVLALGVLYWRYKISYFLFAAFITGSIGLFIPVAASAIHWLWMKLAEGIGFVMNKLILSIVFIIVVVPLGWISRKAGRSAIQLRDNGKSNYKQRNHTYTRQDMENLW